MKIAKTNKKGDRFFYRLIFYIGYYPMFNQQLTISQLSIISCQNEQQ